MEVYVDDMIKKSMMQINHVRDLEGAFKVLRHYGIKLKQRKCTIKVKSRKVLD